MKKLSPQAAMVLAFQAATFSLLVSRPLSLGLIAALAGVYWLAGAQRRHIWWMAAVLALGAWSVVISQGLFYEGSPRTALVRLLPGGVFPFGDPPGLFLYAEGLRYGLIQSLRFSAIVLLGGGVLARYGTDEMAEGLRALRIPSPLCFLFAMSLRFFPLMLAEARAIWHAQHFRGYRLLAGIWPGASPSNTKVLLLPLLSAQVRKADEIAAALRSRGFSLNAETPEDGTPSRRGGGMGRSRSFFGRTALGPTAFATRRELALCGMVGLMLVLLGAALLLSRLAPPGGFAYEWLNWLISMVDNHV